MLPFAMILLIGRAGASSVRPPELSVVVGGVVGVVVVMVVMRRGKSRCRNRQHGAEQNKLFHNEPMLARLDCESSRIPYIEYHDEYLKLLPSLPPHRLNRKLPLFHLKFR